jgi:hypothetical protein
VLRRSMVRACPHRKMNWTPDFHFLIVVTPFTQKCNQECCVDPWSVRVRTEK